VAVKRSFRMIKPTLLLNETSFPCMSRPINPAKKLKVHRAPDKKVTEFKLHTALRCLPRSLHTFDGIRRRRTGSSRG